jgi:hypothetical protein
MKRKIKFIWWGISFVGWLGSFLQLLSSDWQNVNALFLMWAFLASMIFSLAIL